MKAKDAMRFGEAFAQGVRDGIGSVVDEPSRLSLMPYQTEREPWPPNFDHPSYLPMRESLPPRVLDPNPDDEYKAATSAAAKSTMVPFFPEGAISIVAHALMLCGLGRTHVRVEWNAEHATVIAYVTGIKQNQTDAIMSAAIPKMPLGIGIDIRLDAQWTTDELATHDAEKAIDEAKWLAQSDAEIAAGIVPVDDGKDISFDRPAPTHNPETCRDPACQCFPF